MNKVGHPKAEVSFDVRKFRDVLGSFLTGVTVVCTRDAAGARRGITANSFTSVSLSPPLILVCIAKFSSSYHAFCSCQNFSVNLLSHEQRHISVAFASKKTDRFEGLSIGEGITGSPVIEGCLGWLDCSVFNRVDAGDHMILIGQVEALFEGGGSPLGFWKGQYFTSFEAGTSLRALTYLGCILEHRGRVLLQRNSAGKWSLPVSRLEGQGRSHERRISEIACALGLSAKPSFLYSVFEVPDTGTSYIYYRADLADGVLTTCAANAGCELFGSEDLPRGKIQHQAESAMLERYFQELSLARFGIYVDVGSSGRVWQLDQHGW